MFTDRTDRSFARFRRTGDPRALARVFDRTAPELWRVAAHLCRTHHDAEDAVQSTFLSAIESRADWDPARPVLPWLLGLLANRVREQRRRDARVPDVVRLAQGMPDDPVELAARGEFTATLRASLQRLDEPFRSALELHLLHGRAAHEIAAQLGVAAGTVRMRLFRGLEQLRHKLPRGVVAGAAVLARMPSSSFTSVRRAVLAQVPGGEAVAASGPLALGLPGLGLVALQRTQLALVLGVLATLSAWAAWGGPSVAPAAGPEAAAPAAQPSAIVPDPVREAEVPAAAPRVAAVREAVAAPRAGTGRLRVLVRAAWNQAPIADTEIEVAAGLRTPAATVAPAAAPPTAGMVATSLVRARTDAAGVAVFDLPSGLARVRLREFELREPAVTTVAAGRESECLVDVPARFSAAVTVVDADQRAVAGARIVGRVPRDRGLVERDLGVTDAAGRWTDAFADPGVTLRAVARGHAASAAAQLLPQSPDARLVLGGAAAILVGSVSGADGAPSGGVALLILPDAAQGRDAAPLTARTDAAGRYRCEHVPPGPCHVVAARATASGQHRITAASAVASACATTQLDLRFPVGARLVVKFASAAGNVTLVPLHPDLPRTLRFHGMAGADPDARGECVVDGLLPGPYEVRLAGAAPQTLDLRDGETRELVVPAARTAWLELEVIDDEQRPLSGWFAAVDPRPGQGAEGEVVIGGDGRVRVEHLAPGEHVVSLASAAGRVPVLVQSVPCNERTRLVVPRRCLVPCRLRGVAVSSGGGPGDGVVVALHRATSAAWRSRSDAEVPVDPVRGSFVCEALPPGGYHVSVLSAQRQLLALRPHVTVDSAEVDLGRIELGTAAIELVVTRDGQLVRQPLLAIGIADQPFVPWPRDAARGQGVIQLVAGTHRVLVWGTDIAPTVVDVTARVGEHVTVPVAAPAGTPTTLQCTGVAGGSVLGAVTLRRAGAVLCALALTDPNGTLRCGLVPGNYRIEFDDGNGQRGASECTVTGTPGPPIQIAVHR